jgi:PAS domain-containing protein
MPLFALSANPPSGTAWLLLQGNLLAQAGTGLLVASSASWVRCSERRYRQLVAHVPVVVYSVRLTGDPPHSEVTLISAATATLLGCQPEQLLGDHRRWLERIHPNDREVFRAALAQLELHSEVVTCEYRFAAKTPNDWQDAGDVWTPHGATAGIVARTRAAGIRWVRDTLAPQRDDNGRLTGWEGVLTDITEQRVLADDLRRMSSMLHALVSNLPAGVFFVQGSEGRPILVNSRARQLLGQREDATLDQLAAVYRLHRPDGRPYPIAELPVTRALRDGCATMSDDIVVHRADGRRVPLVTWAAPVRLAGVDPDAAVWVLEDLTALHQAECARRDSERRLNAVVQAMAEALIVLDRNGMVVEANPAAETIFNQATQAMRGKGTFDLGPTWVREDGTVLDVAGHPVALALRSSRPVRNSVLGLRIDASLRPTRWLLVNVVPLGTPPSGVVLTLSDVSGYRPSHTEAPAGEREPLAE